MYTHTHEHTDAHTHALTDAHTQTPAKAKVFGCDFHLHNPTGFHVGGGKITFRSFLHTVSETTPTQIVVVLI